MTTSINIAERYSALHMLTDTIVEQLRAEGNEVTLVTKDWESYIRFETDAGPYYILVGEAP